MIEYCTTNRDKIENGKLSFQEIRTIVLVQVDFL